MPNLNFAEALKFVNRGGAIAYYARHRVLTDLYLANVCFFTFQITNKYWFLKEGGSGRP